MLDYVIRGGTVIDGSGRPGEVRDVGVRDGRIVALAAADEPAQQVVDATGLIVCPGFIDPHTHYDAQLHWDPFATPSSEHGVTTVVGGNCGFTLAPIKAADVDYTSRMMARVEGMSLAALQEGVPWNWETFGDFLDRLDGAIGVNAGFLVGHCAVRRYVMGEDAVGSEATDEQLAAMCDLLAASIAAGGLGLSTTLSSTHSDGDGRPVASRWATHEELLALCRVVGEHPGTTLEGIVDGCLDQFADDEIDLLVAMSAAAGRPLNWNVLTVDSRVPARVPRQLGASTSARAAGASLVALTMPILVPMNMSLLTFCALHLLPGWGAILSLPLPERIAQLRDPDVRRTMEVSAHSPEAGLHRRHADFARYVIGETFSEANAGLKGRVVGDIAAERGTRAFDTLVAIAIDDDLRTVLWPTPPDDDEASWTLRGEVWTDDRVLLGGSDAGAHLDRMCGAPYPTRFLGDVIRGRRLVPLERAVQLMTDAPARLFGLRERGRIEPGWWADLVVFDPAEIDSGPATLVRDLPGDSPRLIATAHGIVLVLVNGEASVRDGALTGARSGSVLRSGRDTETVATA
ncbi:MAG: N-acyl-D-aspartate/D-glutamate deacylase [Acidimicrobiales bacterium]|nr:N-acyl-D-aspartate/D-glutamate deacylase [Acidimicrobiales bacterium]